MKRFISPMSPRLRQHGLTLVELLVSMALLGIVTVATVSLYTVAQQNYRTVDTTQEMQDNARFAFDLIGQSLKLAGYQEYMPRYDTSIYKIFTDRVFDSTTNTCATSPVFGANASGIQSVTDVDDCGGNVASTWNSSDTLAVRFFGVGTPADPTQPDGSVVDCQGVAQPSPLVASDLAISLFYVSTNAKDGEPELSCISRNIASATARNSQPIIKGVESFQVMYGIDTDGDTVPNRWVSANSVVASGGWAAVRAVRVGMILRAARGSSQGPSVDTAKNTLYPLGKDFIGTSTEAGLAFAAPSDGRFRRAFTTTFLLRNG